MKSKVYDIITEALKKAEVNFDTDGERIWVHPPQGIDKRTVTLNLIEWDADEDEGQQQADEPEADGADEPQEDLHRFSVTLNAMMGTVVEVDALDESCAEEIVNRRWSAGEIRLDELTNHETRIDCTGRID